jgi:hypothetical protein
MDYVALKQEIVSGNLAAELLGKSDDEMAAILNDKRFTMVKERFITARTLLAELPNGAELLDKLEVLAPMVSAVKWALKFLQTEGGIDIGHPSTQVQIDALVAGSALTVAEGAALKGLAVSAASRAEIVGLGNVSSSDCGGATRGGLA